ncbi:uncharacterized protein LOC113674054 isoform X2 [Pocillopora damicornis]|uniref:uncharacterized protein LOC113674054 isoform X2 n=1 Tax=Pocillopora damicornis TaxID=46731 RepID=UPI000F558160|nr:uncharacterized protein LOC113674054 isoform X2 [Pocillopora damicornis]
MSAVEFRNLYLKTTSNLPESKIAIGLFKPYNISSTISFLFTCTMCSMRFLFITLILVTVLTTQCEAFTAGSGGYKGKRSKSDQSLEAICSAARTHCPESKRSLEEENYTARGRFLS